MCAAIRKLSASESNLRQCATLTFWSETEAGKAILDPKGEVIILLSAVFSGETCDVV